MTITSAKSTLKIFFNLFHSFQFITFIACVFTSVAAGNKKTAAIFLRKITTAEFFCDESQFRWEYGTKPWNITFQHLNLKTSFLCKWALTESYQSRSCDSHHIDKESPHFYILPSQFPNDYLSITDIKTSMHTPTVNRRGFSPHSLYTDYASLMSLYSITDTLCECIKLRLSYSLYFLNAISMQKVCRY